MSKFIMGEQNMLAVVNKERSSTISISPMPIFLYAQATNINDI